MGSRIRENVKHLIQCFCEVVGPQSAAEKDPWIIQKFPEAYSVEEVLKSIPIFAYPCEFQNTVVQHYSFVLTSIDSKYTFGFCRHDPKTETALVVLSYLPWHESFYKLLNHIAEIIHGKNTDELWRFLDAVYQSKVPDPGNAIEIPFNTGQSKFLCQSPNQFQLPSIPENRNLTEYYNAVDSHNMMVIFASMLYERRIIFKSKKLYRLSACVQSANAIIYPMDWQHIYIPVLPMKLMDYLFAPMPYLIGVPELIYDKVRKNDLGDVVVLDADNNTVETPFEDLESLPTEVVNSLRRHLRNRAALLGDGVSRAFLRSLVQLIGGYRDALRFLQGQRITFNRDAFVESRPLAMQPFLRQMLELQIFQQFIEERLERLNNGLGFSDEFEMEACSYSEKSSSKLKHQYKEWTYTMKKEGSAFFKTVRNRANPAMKSAVKSVRERGKDVRSAYKDMRLKWRENSPRESISESRRIDEKPRSAPTSPTQPRRPRTIAGPKSSLSGMQSYRKGTSRPTTSAAKSNSSARTYSPLSPVSDVGSPEVAIPDLGTPGLRLSPLDMDLMGELKDVIFPSSSLQNDSPPVDRTHQDTDLIRLDSTPDEEFDPILAKDLPFASSLSQPRASHTSVGTGMLNPMYPYFVPSIGASSNSRPHTAFNQSRHDQDSALLKDYGIDFNRLTFQNGIEPARTSVSPPRAVTSTVSRQPVVTDSFDSLSMFNKDNPTHKPVPKNWTKFDDVF